MVHTVPLGTHKSFTDYSNFLIHIHWHRNPFDFGGAGVTPVIMDILFAKA